MKHILWSLFISLSLLMQTCVAQPITKHTQHAAMHRILMQTDKGGGYCTATAISPHVLITARHCDEPDGTLTVDDEKTPQAFERVFDGNEHMLLVVPGENFTSYVPYPVIYRPPVQGEHVYFWGNPKEWRDMYREGVTMGKTEGSQMDGIEASGTVYLFQMVDVAGDSGASIYGSDGRLVAILTGGSGIITMGYPLKFTPQQIIDATK